MREEAMRARGMERATKDLQKKLNREDAATTPAGIALTKRALAPVVAHMQAYMNAANAGRAGRKHVAAVLLEGVDLELAAYLAVRVVINAAMNQWSVQAASYRVAMHLRDETIVTCLEKEQPALHRHIIRKARGRGRSIERGREFYSNAARTVATTPVVEWTRREMILIGSQLIEGVLQGAGFAQSVLAQKARNHKSFFLAFVPESEEWFRKYNDATTLTRPFWLPTVVLPRPWETPSSNPYHTEGLVRGCTLVTKHHRVGQPEALAKADLSTVYLGINAIQATPWRINKRVLAVLSEAWERGIDLPGCLPSRFDIPLPEKPEEVDNAETGSPIRQAWRAKIAPIFQKNSETAALRRELDMILGIARENAEEEAIYFPHRCDFRGRVYPMATGLNPQARDEGRGLLEFAEGKPLGERGLFWLGVHGANLFGVDKVSLEDRFNWALKHRDHALAVIQNPLNNLWWTEADKPWCALAWCYEWGVVFSHDNPPGAVSHIPIALDGSCNGIQHFSAMLRDEVGGAAVNLIAADKPRDIYQAVADCVMARLKIHAENTDEKSWIAEVWLHLGIDRKITKRSVMVLPYGGTFLSCIEYVREAAREKLPTNPFGPDRNTAEVFLASLVWASIGDVVISAREIMEWMQKVARVLARENLPACWTTPSGFKVKQFYRKTKDFRVETKFNGAITKFRVQEDTDQIDKARQSNSISPNFVHSMDASAMMLTVKACAAEGITSFAMIHDSYGTHACNTDRLAQVLRKEFARMYTDHDVLSEFLEEVLAVLPEKHHADIPEMPPMGTLCLSEVLKSDYFFA